MSSDLVLASASPFRRMLLENAGVRFDVHPASIDERLIQAPLDQAGAAADDIARVLAQAKAFDVAGKYHNALVIGSDQTLSLGDTVLHKPADMAAARNHLLSMSGKTHQLNSAVVLARGGQIVWSHIETADLTMRELDPGFIGRYLARVGEKALANVGAYQLEGEGVQLFEKIDGDYFTIIGLPLLPLLGALRDLGAIDG